MGIDNRFASYSHKPLGYLASAVCSKCKVPQQRCQDRTENPVPCCCRFLLSFICPLTHGLLSTETRRPHQDMTKEIVLYRIISDHLAHTSRVLRDSQNKPPYVFYSMCPAM